MKILIALFAVIMTVNVMMAAEFTNEQTIGFVPQKSLVLNVPYNLLFTLQFPVDIYTSWSSTPESDMWFKSERNKLQVNCKVKSASINIFLKDDTSIPVLFIASSNVTQTLYKMETITVQNYRNQNDNGSIVTGNDIVLVPGSVMEMMTDMYNIYLAWRGKRLDVGKINKYRVMTLGRTVSTVNGASVNEIFEVNGGLYLGKIYELKNNGFSGISVADDDIEKLYNDLAKQLTVIPVSYILDSYNIKAGDRTGLFIVFKK